ncbi:hypothetical protein [Rhodopseudomonas palustris]|uniref:hypothetical protein n=1 Tax=Rhodopseudomonas palustris TaxID=1076 RepID=UPI001057F78B|nr:hypothetical protein [Rhodopseudomonas palustris]
MKTNGLTLFELSSSALLKGANAFLEVSGFAHAAQRAALMSERALVAVDSSSVASSRSTAAARKLSLSCERSRSILATPRSQAVLVPDIPERGELFMRARYRLGRARKSSQATIFTDAVAVAT